MDERLLKAKIRYTSIVAQSLSLAMRDLERMSELSARAALVGEAHVMAFDLVLQLETLNEALQEKKQ